MPKNEAINYYKLIKDAYSDKDNKYDNFFEYFESTWLSLEDNCKSKSDFELWSYHNKFNFKGNKNKLISEDKLNDYVFFTNNCVESFNNLLNKCINYNSKISFAKFEEVIKFVFIRMEGGNDEQNQINGYEEKTLLTDILSELVGYGFGKNNKIIKKNDLKKLKSNQIIADIYKLSFESSEEKDNELESI